MATPTVVGTETEFGITLRGAARFNPAVASALVVGAKQGLTMNAWFKEALLASDEAGEWGAGVALPEGTGVNRVLENGARFYVDHAHPEYSTPETTNPKDATLYDKAGEETLRQASRLASEAVGGTNTFGLYKNNSDGKGNSYGFHENVMLDRRLPFGEVVRLLPTFLVTRQIVAGAGKVPTENGRPAAPYQVSQRSDFFEELVGLETTMRRPLINTRDEPHSDPAYRRLHVIYGDANMSELQTFVKIGSLMWFLAAVEAGALDAMPRLLEPVMAGDVVSRDLDLGEELPLVGGGSATALEIQQNILERLQTFGHAPEGLADEWADVLDTLAESPSEAADRLDWVAKLQILKGFAERGIAWSDPKMRAIDLQYHDLDHSRSLHRRLVETGRMRRLFTDSQIEEAVSVPPADTRAWLRGTCVRRFSPEIVSATWDSLIFMNLNGELSRVPMMSPHGATEAELGDIVRASESASELVARLGGMDG
jgi:proteasome accessory factor PafA2